MIPPELMTRYSAAKEACLHRITGHPPMTMAGQLAAIAEQTTQFDVPDVYGTGELIETFEAKAHTLVTRPSSHVSMFIDI